MIKRCAAGWAVMAGGIITAGCATIPSSRIAQHFDIPIANETIDIRQAVAIHVPENLPRKIPTLPRVSEPHAIWAPFFEKCVRSGFPGAILVQDPTDFSRSHPKGIIIEPELWGFDMHGEWGGKGLSRAITQVFWYEFRFKFMGTDGRNIGRINVGGHGRDVDSAKALAMSLSEVARAFQREGPRILSTKPQQGSSNQ